MDLNTFMQKYAEEIDGQYSEYDEEKSIIIVPLEDNRFQTVLGHVRSIEKYEKHSIEFSSKVCEFDQSIDLKKLLEENANFVHAKFLIVDNYIKVEAASFIESVTEEVLKEIIQEVANLADEYEFKLTGVDVH
ncbi:MAG: hypothetical protein AAFX87_02250 [Bacteroidota bacterium]